jgi:hypothetical protein
MEITGHATWEMFDRYSAIDVKDIELGSHQFEGYLERNVAQSVDQDDAHSQ